MPAAILDHAKLVLNRGTLVLLAVGAVPAGLAQTFTVVANAVVVAYMPRLAHATDFVNAERGVIALVAHAPVVFRTDAMVAAVQMTHRSRTCLVVPSGIAFALAEGVTLPVHVARFVALPHVAAFAAPPKLTHALAGLRACAVEATGPTGLHGTVFSGPTLRAAAFHPISTDPMTAAVVGTACKVAVFSRKPVLTLALPVPVARSMPVAVVQLRAHGDGAAHTRKVAKTCTPFVRTFAMSGAKVRAGVHGAILPREGVEALALTFDTVALAIRTAVDAVV